MQFRTRWVAGPVLAACLTAAGFAATSASAAARPAVTSYTTTAVTNVSNRPDSGDHGDWANDTMARSASAVADSPISRLNGARMKGARYEVWGPN